LATAAFLALRACCSAKHLDWMCQRFHEAVSCDHLLRILDLGLSVEQFVRRNQPEKQGEAIGFGTSIQQLW